MNLADVLALLPSGAPRTAPPGGGETGHRLVGVAYPPADEPLGIGRTPVRGLHLENSLELLIRLVQVARIQEVQPSGLSQNRRERVEVERKANQR